MEIKQKSGKPVPVRVEIVKANPVRKADTVTQITPQEGYNAGDWINQPVDFRGLRAMAQNSSILPQCIRAYKSNIAGFGIGIRYMEDVEETEEMKAEWDMAKEVLELLSMEKDTKEVFEDIIEARETYGISYLEVIRNLAGEVRQIEFIRDTPSVEKTKPLDPYITISFWHHGKEAERKKRFCKYKQQLGGKTVYFKEFGDPRIMDNRSGEYLQDGETLELQYQANEILEFAIGTEPYGEVRWVGQILGVDGSRKAESLNNNYFENGRHTPLLIMIRGGTLSDESFAKLQQYMEDIKGPSGQHAFLVLEAESIEGRASFEGEEKPEFEIHDLANILQKDELFQEYLDNNRRRVQSAFRLPDLYVGYTTDFNRATAQTAQEVTEKQVFQPERKSLAWIINNKLLNGYHFRYVEAYFLEPNISNPDDLTKILTIANTAGGLTPNKAKQIVYEALGETAEDYPENAEEAAWGDIPLTYSKSQSPGSGFDFLTMSLQKQIAKASKNHDDDIVAVMKEVRDLLRQMDKGDTNERQAALESY